MGKERVELTFNVRFYKIRGPRLIDQTFPFFHFTSVQMQHAFRRNYTLDCGLGPCKGWKHAMQLSVRMLAT